MESKRFDLNTNDLRRVFDNTALFLAPAVLVFLLAIQSGQTVEQSLIVLKLWVLNSAIDLLKKFIAGK